VFWQPGLAQRTVETPIARSLVMWDPRLRMPSGAPGGIIVFNHANL